MSRKCEVIKAASVSDTFDVVTMYNRAVASDFDDWEQMHKNPGWGAKEIVPLLKKVRRRIHVIYA